ncbi:YjbE family putative metal transport protein [Heliobacterium undosum]|uniref:YjbE family putative metal transport protein n=1 Tax=Heliomicrobium undosum TaxID=121734 RepID=A0A845L5T0_9FIRM|nr:TerC family protein [Heliomicrobium undosum]MZP28291.1 YjbE family putative metal transport protein [Heliomicrobium undosum]
MEFITPGFFSALLAIVAIDLVLAGDNAIVIGLAARNLPREHQRKAIVWGTVGAIVIRATATVAVVWLLKIPGLLLIGGLLLLWIAYKLIVEEKEHDIKSEKNLMGAIRTIIVADAVMGIDNVLAVAGAAHGSFLLVVLGLLISVPIVVWGSTLFIRLVERFPIILYLGAGVIAWTAGSMVTSEPFLKGFIVGMPVLGWVVPAIFTVGVILLGRNQRQASLKASFRKDFEGEKD